MRKNKVSAKRKRGNYKKILAKKRVGKQKLILGTFLICILGLFLNLAYINIVYGDEFARRAIQQQVNHNGVDRTINPNRGSILDRNGQVLAASTTVYSIILDVRMLFEESYEVQNHTVEVLYNTLGIPKERIWSYLEVNPETGRATRDTHYLVLERQVPRDLANELMDQNPRRVWLEEDTLRTYTHGALAGPVVGFTRGNNSNWGLERQYNEELTGVPGRLVRMFDENGNAFTQEFRPQTGYTLVTTLDLTMQQFAVESAQKYGSMYNARRASVIIMDPNTGEVLAMAQYPTFDPNEPFNTELINSERLRYQLQDVPEDKLMEELFEVWANHTITHSFEPGSIFKPMVAAAAFEEGLVSRNDTFFCPGYKEVAGVRINCWNTSGHGTVNLSQSMAVSCNVAIIEIAQKMGREMFYNYKRDFGVGQLTGIDLHGEFSAAPLTYTLSQLNPVELATSSMGQGFNMTPIQSIVAFSAVINGGYIMQPFIVSQIVDNQGNVVIENTPIARRQVISQSTSDFWREEMVHTFSDHGTGRNARVDGFSIGGKTGTAQQGDRESGEYTLSFIGYLPADNPQYIVLTVIDRPDPFIQGVTSPQPMLKGLMEDIIRYKAIPPTNLNIADSSLNTTVVVENYIGQTLNQTIRSLNEKDLVFDVIGNGTTIINQQPLPGSRVAHGSKIFLYLSDDDMEEELTLIPNVQGMTITQAQQTLEIANLTYNIIKPNGESEAYITQNDSAIVIEQMPSAGARVAEGTEVSLIVR